MNLMWSFFHLQLSCMPLGELPSFCVASRTRLEKDMGYPPLVESVASFTANYEYFAALQKNQCGLLHNLSDAGSPPSSMVVKPTQSAPSTSFAIALAPA